jgi:hypothetical protein
MKTSIFYIFICHACNKLFFTDTNISGSVDAIDDKKPRHNNMRLSNTFCSMRKR